MSIFFTLVKKIMSIKPKLNDNVDYISSFKFEHETLQLYLCMNLVVVFVTPFIKKATNIFMVLIK